MNDNGSVNSSTALDIRHLYVHPKAGVCKHYVYELYTADGSCLYVGRTAILGSRLEVHMVKKWWAEVGRIEVTVHPDFETARDAEKARIQQLSPAHNEQFNDSWRANAAATRVNNRQRRHALGELCPPSARCVFCRSQYAVVKCPDCNADIGQECITVSGARSIHGHSTRRKLAMEKLS